MAIFEGSPEETGRKNARDFIARVEKSFDVLNQQHREPAPDVEKSFQASFEMQGHSPAKAAKMAHDAAAAEGTMMPDYSKKKAGPQ